MRWPYHVYDVLSLYTGFIPAAESNYSIAAAIDEALECKESGEEKTILFNLSGHGFMDMHGFADILKLE